MPKNAIRHRLKRRVLSSVSALVGDDEGRVMLPVIRGPAAGLWFRFDLHTRLETKYFTGSYDLPIMRHLVRICQRGWTVWDCGSYLGFYTAIFARLVGPEGRVIAFEPDPRNLRRTRENTELNGLNNVRCIGAAIGAAADEIDFILSDNTNSHIPGTFVGATRTEYEEVSHCGTLTRVRCLSLDKAYFEERLPQPQLLKLDLEGAEIDALDHCSELVSAIKPIIVLELHNPECDAAAWRFAQRLDYSLVSLLHGRELRRRDEVSGTLLCMPKHRIAT